MNSNSDNPESPRWILNIANRVDALVGDSAVREHFKQKFRECREESLQRQDTVGVDDPNWDAIRDRVMPNRALTLSEKYLWLGAIRDKCCEDVERIIPEVDVDDVSIDESKHHVWYEAKFGCRVFELKECHRDRIMEAFDDVYADLLALGLVKKKTAEMLAPTSHVPAESDGIGAAGVTVPTSLAAGDVSGKALAQARHSQDFRSVHWDGIDYTFTATQAACVKVMWEAFKNDTPDVGDTTIIEAAGSAMNNPKLFTIFRDHPAWGTLIVEGATKGTHRLAGPAKK